MISKYKKNKVSITPELTFANEYFELLSSTKKIRKNDVDFFFEYYNEERKNMHAICEMLIKNFKVIDLGKNYQYQDKNIDEKSESASEPKESLSIVGSFKKNTVLKLKKCSYLFEILQVLSESECGNLYDFLELDKANDIDGFINNVSEKTKESEQLHSLNNDNTTYSNVLSDLYLTASDLGKHKDVIDNFDEFKIIVKYTKLTPYMFSLGELKSKTLKSLFEIAKREYSFSDETDFLLNYVLRVHDDFAISVDAIKLEILKAKYKERRPNKTTGEKRTKTKSKIKQKRDIPIWAMILHFFAYWPVFFVYIVFETFKAIFTETRKFVVPSFILVFLSVNAALMFSDIDTIFSLLKIFNKDEWLRLLDCYFPLTSAPTLFELIVCSLMFIIFEVLVCVVPALFVSRFIQTYSILASGKCEEEERGFSWRGGERTFQNIFERLKVKTSFRVSSDKKLFLKEYLIRCTTNVLSVALIVLAITYLPTGIQMLGEKTGYFEVNSSVEDDAAVELIEKEYVEVVVESANVYKTFNFSDDAIATLSQGQTVLLTGKSDESSYEYSKYEIYLDDDCSEKGWVYGVDIGKRIIGAER